MASMGRSSLCAMACMAFVVNASGMPPAAAQDSVGVASAVNQSAESQRGTGPLTTIRIGKRMFDREQIRTGASGRVQVLLADGSNFMVGPNSNLVIDEFVYRPDAGEGKLVATFGRGVARFVGGRISKQRGGVTIRTRQGTVGIRGGMADLLDQNGQSIYSFLFGGGLTFTGNSGQTTRVYRPGFSIFVSGGTGRSGPTPQDIIDTIRSLLAGNGPAGGRLTRRQLDQFSQVNSDLPPDGGRQTPPPVIVSGARDLPESRLDVNHANSTTISEPYYSYTPYSPPSASALD